MQQYLQRTFGILMVMFGFAVPSLLFAAAPTDAVHHWKFDEGTGRSINDTAASSVIAQNGVMVGTSTGFGWASGKIGNGLAMDGTTGTGVVLPDGALTGTVATISVWFKIQSYTDRNVLLAARSTDDRNIYMVLMTDIEGRPTLQFKTSSSDAVRRMQVTKPLNKNEWYHLVLITDGQQYRAVINGEDQGTSGENTGRWFANFTNRTLGYRIGTADTAEVTGSFDGYIDDLRIFDRALTSVEAKALFDELNDGVPTIPPAALPQITFTISTDNIAKGGTATLTWNVTNGVSCMGSGGWTGDTGLSGTRTFTNITADTAYTLNCAGRSGNATATVRVFVGGAGASTSSVSVVQTMGGSQQTVVTASSGGQTVTGMSGTERQAKISEIRAKLVTLYIQLLEMLRAQLALKQAAMGN